jgi:hypothetical protein
MPKDCPSDEPPRPREEPFELSAVHVMTITAASPASLLDSVAAGVTEARADLVALSLRSVGPIAEATVRLTGLSCAAARGFADLMALRAGVLSSRVEHHLLR